LNRRTFSQLLLSSAFYNSTNLLADHTSLPSASEKKTLRVGIIADTHIIDSFYKGPEDNPEDTESMQHTLQRLTAARDHLNALHPSVEQVFHLGDIVHDCPSSDYDFYRKNKTRLDIVKENLDGFHAPVHLCFGNHDYSLPVISREMSHRLFAEKFQAPTYKSITWQGWKFLLLNNFLGDTWRPSSPSYDQGVGTLGEEHLQWVEAELAKRQPTVILIHYPLWLIQPTEFHDFGLHPLIRKYQDSIALLLSGHWHKWIDFAHTYGPRHMVVAATRYDANAYMVLELDASTLEYKFVNQNCVDWSTHYSRPYL
jgi:3',5'-cyclic-AMP phosphodiesterase